MGEGNIISFIQDRGFVAPSTGCRKSLGEFIEHTCWNSRGAIQWLNCSFWKKICLKIIYIYF